MSNKTPAMWIIFSEEFRRLLRSKWYQISTVAVIIIMIAVMFIVPAIANRGDSTNQSKETSSEQKPSEEKADKPLGFVDESGLFSTIEEDLAQNEAAQIDLLQLANRELGLQAIAKGDISWLYIVPSDYISSGKVEQYGEFIGRFPSNPQGENAISTLLVDCLLGGELEPERKLRIFSPAQYENHLAKDGEISTLPPIAEEMGGLLIPIIFSALLAFGLAAGVGTVVQSIAEEKESRIVEVTVTSASPLSVVAGKLLALTAIGLIQAALWIITFAFTIPELFRRLWDDMGTFSPSFALWITIICCFIAGYFLLTSLAIFVGAVSPSPRDASSVGTWVALINVVPMWLMSLIMVSPDGLPARIISYLPFTATTGILTRIGAGGDMASWKVAISLVCVILVGILVLWISAKVFRAAVLLKGQKFGLRNLWSSLRNAG